MNEIRSTQSLSSVSNALRILNSFTAECPEKRLSDLAAELNLGKSTVSRLLTTLAAEGYVRKDPETRKYSLGLRILSIASALASNLQIVREARPILQQLVQETDESAQLAELDGDRLIYVDQVKCRNPIRIYAHVGRINPIHATSLGRLLLAYENEKRQQEILQGDLKSYTEHTIIDPIIIAAGFESIRQQGYAILTDEFIEGLISISAPIWDYREKVIAAISLVGSNRQIQGERLNYCLNRVINAAAEISEKMGYWKK